MSSIQQWIYAARPKTLFIGISPILIGTCIALHEGCFHLSTFLWTLLGALSIQIGTNYSNDYFDFLKGADTSKRKGPPKLLQQGILSPVSMKTAFIICFLIAALCSIILTLRAGPILLVIGAVCILFSILYTAPPLPLAYLGLGDLFVFLFYGPVATATCYYLHTFHVSYPVLIAACAPGLLGLGPLTLNNLRDHEEDKLVNKKTFVVRFGTTRGKIHCILALLLAFLTPPLLVCMTSAHLGCLLACLPLLWAIPIMKTLWTSSNPYEFQALFAKTAFLIPSYTLLFCLGYLLK